MFGDSLREIGVPGSAAGSRVIGKAGRAVQLDPSESVRGDGVDESQRGYRPVYGVVGDRCTARGPTDQVYGTPNAKSPHQREGVVGPIAQSPGPIDRIGLRVAEAAHVGSDQAVAGGRARHQVLKEAAGGQVAVDHDNRHAVLWAGLDVAHAQAVGFDVVRPDSRQKVHGALPRGAEAFTTLSRNLARGA